MWGEFETAGVGRERHFDRDVLVFSNRPKHVSDLFERTFNRFPEREALVMEGRRVTYKEMHHFVERIAGGLYFGFGIRKGDRVAMLLGNCIEFVYLFFACARIGAIAVPLNTRLAEREIRFMLDQSGAAVLVTDMEFASKVDQVNDLPAKFVVGGTRAGFLPFDELLTSTQAAPKIEVGEEDPMYIMYTSGTTGLPKGAVGSHIGIIHSVMSYNWILKTTEEDRSLDAVPLFHVTGLIGQLLHMVYVGGTNVILRRFKADEFIHVMNKEKITFLFNVPTVYVMLMNHPLFHDQRYDSVRIACYGGAPMSPQTIRQLKQEFPGVRVHNAYGATETTSPTTVMPANADESKLTAVGWPIPVIEVKIVNPEDGTTCAVNEIGELWIKGPNVVKEYWNNKEANDKLFVGGYWRSGDLAMLDEDSFVYIMDRTKDMMADYKAPKEVEICVELPRNPGGKVLKNVLRSAKKVI